MLQKLARFMMGRYGSDKLNIVLLVTGMVISLVSQLIRFFPLIFISYFLFGYALFRTFSRNIGARQKEYYSFLKLWTPIEKWFKMRKMVFAGRKTYRYFRCPNCKQQLRAPKGKGKIQITCQKCHKEFIKKV
ncbi:MAG: hypothetical protein RSC76_04135 [Oscillospiraceae bacterium]